MKSDGSRLVLKHNALKDMVQRYLDEVLFREGVQQDVVDVRVAAGGLNPQDVDAAKKMSYGTNTPEMDPVKFKALGYGVMEFEVILRPRAQVVAIMEIVDSRIEESSERAS